MYQRSITFDSNGQTTRCCCPIATVGARGTRAVAASAHSSDGLPDISGPLLLSPTIAMGDMASDDHCYCWARGTCVGAPSAHSSDGSSNTSGPLLLPPIVATCDMTLDDRCYCWSRGTQ
jgi:hypothetical protein